MQYEYKTKGTCSQRIIFDIVDGKVLNVQFIGGCNGNLQGISKLVEGMDAQEVIQKIEGSRHPARISWQKHSKKQQNKKCRS